MGKIVLVLLLLSSLTAFGQSGRTALAGTQVQGGGTTGDLTVKDMFDEVNGYAKAKFVEYEAKKVRYSDELLEKTKLEQRQLAAKYAAVASERKDLAGEDLYYLGMLHWLAVNLDGAIDSFQKFIAIEDAPAPRRQTARSILVVALAKRAKLPEAEAVLSAYLAAEPVKLTEQSRMGSELAKAYQAKKDAQRMAPHAEAGYKASKALLKQPGSQQRGLDELFDLGMLVYEAHRDSGDPKKAITALDELRSTAASVQSPSLYYYAVDQKIKYLIDTGRKSEAMESYLTSLIDAGKELTVKTAQAEVLRRLKKREKHYKLLGEPAPDLPAVDKWFPGERKSMADLKGKVVLLDFWATWCRPCFEAFPHLIEWHQDFSASGLEILGVTRYEGNIKNVPVDKPGEIEYFKEFRLKERLPYDFVVANDQSIQMLYGGTALPTAVLIDRKGVIRYIESGTSPTRMVQIREMIVKLLAEK